NKDHVLAQRHVEFLWTPRMGRNDRTVVTRAAAMHIEICLCSSGGAWFWGGLFAGFERQFSQFAPRGAGVEGFAKTIENFSFHFYELHLHAIDLLHENTLHPLRPLTPPPSFC